MEDTFDGFTVNLYLDEEGDWIAHFLELPNISAFADTPEQALKELAIAWEGVKERAWFNMPWSRVTLRGRHSAIRL